MIVKVARAIHASIGFEERWPHPECTQCMDAARSAIEALREPTEAMLKAVDVDVHEEPDAPPRNLDSGTAATVWRQMIGAATE